VGGFVNWANHNCSQISTPPAAYHCHRQHHNHHHHNFIHNFIAERQNVWKFHAILYIYFSTFKIMSHSSLPKTRNVSDKILFIIQSNISCLVTFFEIYAVYEIMWNNMVEQGRPQMSIWPIPKASWTIKTINTHSEYVILIAFPLQHCLHKSAKMLHYTQIASLANINFR